MTSGSPASGSSASPPENRPEMGGELPDIPGGWTQRDIRVEGRSWRIVLPADPDAFLDDPDIQAENRRSDFMPYWPHLWPASLQMAALVLREPWPAGTTFLEIGSGIGLVGLAPLALGHEVTFSDYAPTAVQLSLHNARLNGFSRARGEVFDWRNPPDRSFSVILGCEVIYEPGNHSLVLDVLDKMLPDGGVCWIGDPGRSHAERFVPLARQRGYSVELRDGRGAPRDSTRMNEFQLLILRRRQDWIRGTPPSLW